MANRTSLLNRCRRGFRGFGIASIVLLSSLSLLHAQSLETRFTRQINRFAWEGQLGYEKSDGKWQGTFLNRFQSEVFQLGTNLLSFRDENSQNFRIVRTLRPTTDLRFYGKQYLFAQNKVFTQDLLAAFRYNLPQYAAFVEPQLGFSLDQRKGITQPDGTTPLNRDAGLATGLSAGWQHRFENGYSAAFSTQNLFQWIHPRQGIAMLLQGNLDRNMDEKGRYQLQTRYAKLQRQSYQPLSLLNRENISQSIESVSADTLAIEYQIENQVRPNWFFIGKIGVNHTQRQVRTKSAPQDALFFDTDLNHLEADADLALRFQGKKIVFLGGLRRGAANERRRLANANQLPPTQAAIKGDLLRKTDFDRTNLGLYGDAQWQLSEQTLLQGEASGSIFRHDTPNTNPDDRDEALHQAGIRARSALSAYLTAEISLWGQYHHLVYLNAERSAENNIQRTLRLRPQVLWQPSGNTHIKVQPEIRVSYTVADFALPGRTNTDQSARELRYQVEFRQDLPENSRLTFKTESSDLRLGRLIWARFAEIPYDTIQTFSGKIGLESARNDGKIPFKVEVGMQAFFRSDAERNLTLRYPLNGGTASLIRNGKSFIRQIGPTALLNLKLDKGSEISLNGWLAFQRVYHRLYGNLPTDHAQIIQETAKKGTFRLIPDVQLHTIWRF